MKSFFGPRSGKSSQRATVVWVVLCCGFLIAAFIVGISNNLPGLALCYAAAISVILAFTHTWRKVKYFLILLGTSAVGFGVFVILHNVFYGLGEMAGDVIVLSWLLEFLHVAFFLIAIFVCPAGFLVGVLFLVCWWMVELQKKLYNKYE